jgi:hypothetical protein
MSSEYLTSAKKLFQYYQSLGDRTFDQLNDEQLFWQYNAESNSIATIVKHLAGNMLSRWTDFLTSDGEKEWRNRESEFENDIDSREKMIALWSQGWECLFNALDSLKPEDLEKEIYIRNMGHVVVDAINRQLSHYAYHVGQIVFIGKMLCNEEWTSLSIPRGKSGEYNARKFSEPKHKEHFTDELFKKLKK